MSVVILIHLAAGTVMLLKECRRIVIMSESWCYATKTKECSKSLRS